MGSLFPTKFQRSKEKASKLLFPTGPEGKPPPEGTPVLAPPFSKVDFQRLGVKDFLSNLAFDILNVGCVLFNCETLFLKSAHNKPLHQYILGLPDAVAPRNRLVLNGRVPVWADKVDLAVKFL